MSGIVSGIGKAFTSVIGSAVKVGQAVAGVGSTLFTAGAAAPGRLGVVVAVSCDLVLVFWLPIAHNSLRSIVW